MLTLEDLAALHAEFQDSVKTQVAEFAVGSQLLAFNSRPVIMGVINLSADSWYRESVCLTADRAIQRGKVLVAQGAQLLDVGAESTLAHAERVDEAKQKSRLFPVVDSLSACGIPVSVETYRPAVAEALLKAGAAVLNLTGAEQAEVMYRIAAEHRAAVIICYVQGKNVREVTDYRFSADPVGAMHEYFAREIERAQVCGVEKIFIDPGLGFYYRNLQDSTQRVRFQMKVFLSTFRLRKLGFPICHALPHAFEYFGEEVRSAEAFFAVLAALGKTDLFRTHEVARIKAVLDTMAVF